MKFRLKRLIHVFGTACLIAATIWGISSVVGPAHTTYAAAKGPLISQDQVKLLEQLNHEQTAIAKAVTPAVVSITGTKQFRSRRGESPFSDDPLFRQFFGREFNMPRQWQERFLGSGAVVSEDGYIITNNHVVEKAKKVVVIFSDRRELEGKVVGADPSTDVAVVKVDAKGLAALPWGDSSGLQVGEMVFAVGSPFGYSQTLTQGTVSFIGRRGVIDGEGYENFIQTDAAINPGNSGGPLVNIRGEIIGINAAIASASGGFNGVGFAVPSNLARGVLESLVKYGKVTRPWLGVSIENLDEGLVQSFGAEGAKGALVNEVSKGSPAEKAGIKRGDVIVRFGAEDVLDSGHLKYLVGQSAPDSKVKLIVLREGKKKEFEVKLETQPKDMKSHFGGYRRGDDSEEEQADNGSDYDNALKGVTIQELTKALADRMDVPPDVQGVLVSDVDQDSVAAQKGLRKGDVIEEVKRQSVRSVADFNRIAAKLKKDETVLLTINRQGMNLFIALTPERQSKESKD